MILVFFFKANTSVSQEIKVLLRYISYKNVYKLSVHFAFMNGFVHLCILYSLFRKIGEAGRSDWAWTLWEEKVSIIINYHLPLINCSIEIKCLNLCLSKICLDFFETSLMLMENLRQREVSDQAWRKGSMLFFKPKEGEL